MRNKLDFSLYFVCLLFCCNVTFGQEGWGHLKGQILVEGKLPEIKPEKVDRDRDVCLAGKKEPPLDDNLLVGKQGGLKDAFVMMYLKRKKPAVHPSYKDQLNKPVEIDNKNCRFAPHALFVRVGQALRMKNSDDVGHNCHSTLFNNEFNVNVPVGDFVDWKMVENEKVPGVMTCDFHKWMDAVVLVREEPYVAITDENGSFEIENVPVGKWKFQFWHKKTAYMKTLDVPGFVVGKRGEIEVEIVDGKVLDLGKLRINGNQFNK